ncbi:MAG TPA: lipoate--protein ligase [Ignavibacteria bacterium]|nr:lipoate--protein ligase [Ignavibacteria bacterium]
MKLIDNKDIHDASVNLALEEYCVRNLDFSEEMFLLFYINDPSIIIGKHQNTIEEINKDYVDSKGIKVVRRISGGGAVYHDRGNLNFSFMTKYSPEFFHNFEKFTRPVVETLNTMGVKAELGGRNDITVEGRKISGNAQFTNLKTMFSHGTLLLDSHLEDVVQALNVKIDKIESKGIKSVRSRVANISEFLNEKISVGDFRQKIIDNVFKEYDELPVLNLTDEQWNDVMKLSETKYRTWEWNFGRSPEFNIQKVRRFEFGQVDARIFVKEGRIVSVKFFGDFLGYGDSEDVEKLLTGIIYREDAVSKALTETDLRYYFGSIKLNDFVKFICN